MRARLLLFLTPLVLAGLTWSSTPAAADNTPPPKGPADRMSHPFTPSSSPSPTGQAPRFSPDAKVSPHAMALTPSLGVRGADQALWVWNGSGFQSFGGILKYEPTVVVIPALPAQAPLTLYIATGGDNDLWVRSDSTGWRRLSDHQVGCTGSPTATETGAAPSAVLTVGCRGADSALWAVTQAVSSFGIPVMSGWQSFGGILLSGPASAPLNGAVAFFGTGGDAHIWQRGLNYGWSQLQPICFGHPEAGAGGGYTLVACRAMDNAVWVIRNSGGGWSVNAGAGGIVKEVLTVRSLDNGVVMDVAGGDDAAWEDVDTPGGQSGWYKQGGIVASEPVSPYIDSAPLYQQSMPLDCETAVLQMALAQRGHPWAQSDLFAAQNPDTRPAFWDSGGTLHWGDPFTNFVGNVNGSESNYTGYGVYSPPIVSVAQSHGWPSAGGGQGWAPVAVYNSLATGHLVQAWVEYHWARPGLGQWLAWDGRWITYSTWEHSVLLRGVSENAVLVNDPTNPNPYWVDRGTFQASFADFGNMAVEY